MNYPDELRQYVVDQRAQGFQPDDIARDVRERWPEYVGFTNRAVTRIGKSYKPRHDALADRRTKPIAPSTTCQYITAATYPNMCGEPGYPYCEHHKKQTSTASMAGSSFQQFKSYAGVWR